MPAYQKDDLIRNLRGMSISSIKHRLDEIRDGQFYIEPATNREDAIAARKNYREYRALAKEIAYFFTTGKKSTHISDEDFKSLKPLIESLVAADQVQPALLDAFL